MLAMASIGFVQPWLANPVPWLASPRTPPGAGVSIIVRGDKAIAADTDMKAVAAAGIIAGLEVPLLMV
jgi:hypothetical protein